MKGFLIIAFFIVLCLPAFTQSFVEVSEDSGILHSYGRGSSGGGVSFYDFNKDGWDDITLASQANRSIYFYKNNNGNFELINSLVSDLSETKQILWIDFDNDGDMDLFTTSFEEVNRLYRNTGELHFDDITETAGLSMAKMKSFGAAWADFNNDGWLDLYVTNKLTGGMENANSLYMNKGDGTFEDITESSGTSDSLKRPFSVSFVDINNDHFPDLYIAQDKKAGNTLLKNMGNGQFEDISVASGSNLIMDGMCVAAGDINNSGYLDMYITNLPLGNKLLRNNGNDTFLEMAVESGVAYNGYGWGSNFLDFDNDTDLDLYVCGMLVGSDEIPNLLFTNDGTGNFESENNGFEGDTVMSYSNAVGDFNNDGYPDIVVNNYDPFNSMVWKNSGGSNNWIKIELEGVTSNRDGIGSGIYLYMNGTKLFRYTQCGVGFLGQNSGSEIIGLDGNETIDFLEIAWPLGHVDKLYDIPANQKIKIIEGSTSLPPKIYHNNRDLICDSDSVILETGFFKTYLWSNGSSNRKITIKESGDYFVRVSDKEGNSAYSDTVSVKVFESPSLLFSSTPSDSKEGNGIAEVNASGGIQPYDYHWIGYNSQKENLMTGLLPGNYEIIVTDSVGCKTQGIVNVESVTGIEKELREIIHIYPNPANTFFIIEIPEFIKTAQWQLLGLRGEEITPFESLNSGKHEINFPQGLRGLYIVQISVNGIFNRHLLIKR